MDAVVENIRKRGFESKGVWDVLQGGGAGGASFRVIDVGDDPPHGLGPGGISA